jgi:tRNA-Thr(GGU) m(6)t(6)A37 methyltransferase TsaA
MESVKFIGYVSSSLTDLKDCPLQEREGAPGASLVINSEYISAIDGLETGAKIIVLTWLHKGDRNVLTTKPRNDPNAKTVGVFATRSPERPNPIGIHQAEIIEIRNGEIKISNLEVLDGTPVIDIKPVI